MEILPVFGIKTSYGIAKLFDWFDRAMPTYENPEQYTAPKGLPLPS
tara:strand:- start:52 stop:189 length:138 start_codon:yes stop_codon:yes gene_type:complete